MCANYALQTTVHLSFVSFVDSNRIWYDVHQGHAFLSSIPVAKCRLATTQSSTKVREMRISFGPYHGCNRCQLSPPFQGWKQRRYWVHRRGVCDLAFWVSALPLYAFPCLLDLMMLWCLHWFVKGGVPFQTSVFSDKRLSAAMTHTFKTGWRWT